MYIRSDWIRFRISQDQIWIPISLALITKKNFLCGFPDILLYEDLSSGDLRHAFWTSIILCKSYEEYYSKFVQLNIINKYIYPGVKGGFLSENCF